MDNWLRVDIVTTKIVIPSLFFSVPNTAKRYYLTQISFALMILKKSIPDPYVSLPLRAIKVNYDLNADGFMLKEECFTAGWHFFYKGVSTTLAESFLIRVD